ncbi:TPA: hypothetical protein OUL20_001665 [Clostridioides difficile]|uniref:DUF960 family protein n=1 Tax=Clostridioides difficile TaxID=1496 RepID=UPI00093EECDA|nr:DUF960 family protein [Clostridioides difficile]MBY2437015.1 DUF960 domain-containing protein [Clostridioides difficile]TQX30485.1 hypothetical protein D1N55_07295 [Clostridioides difficile]HBG5845440.1 hypothetical protein [Clostridioides difficile]HCU2761804.1 hypothetical protein [Clostridioides difficile]
MFKKENRYMTREIAENLPIEITILLWDLIDNLDIEKDYLQIFEINPIGLGVVEIVHRQEVPEYEASIYIQNDLIKYKLKIYAIDSIKYSTMIFSNEY